MLWFKAIMGLLGIGGEVLKSKANLKLEKVKGEIRVIQTASENISDWEKIHAKGSQTSWKDEFWTIVFAIPLIMGFVGYADKANDGFLALANMPDWYQYTLVTMVLASFGIRINSLIRGKMKL